MPERQQGKDKAGPEARLTQAPYHWRVVSRFGRRGGRPLGEHEAGGAKCPPTSEIATRPFEWREVGVGGIRRREMPPREGGRVEASEVRYSEPKGPCAAPSPSARGVGEGDYSRRPLSHTDSGGFLPDGPVVAPARRIPPARSRHSPGSIAVAGAPTCAECSSPCP